MIAPSGTPTNTTTQPAALTGAPASVASGSKSRYKQPVEGLIRYRIFESRPNRLSKPAFREEKDCSGRDGGYLPESQLLSKKNVDKLPVEYNFPAHINHIEEKTK